MKKWMIANATKIGRYTFPGYFDSKEHAQDVYEKMMLNYRRGKAHKPEKPVECK